LKKRGGRTVSLGQDIREEEGRKRASARPSVITPEAASTEGLPFKIAKEEKKQIAREPAAIGLVKQEEGRINSG